MVSFETVIRLARHKSQSMYSRYLGHMCIVMYEPGTVLLLAFIRTCAWLELGGRVEPTSFFRAVHVV